MAESEDSLERLVREARMSGGEGETEGSVDVDALVAQLTEQKEQGGSGGGAGEKMGGRTDKRLGEGAGGNVKGFQDERLDGGARKLVSVGEGSRLGGGAGELLVGGTVKGQCEITGERPGGGTGERPGGGARGNPLVFVESVADVKEMDISDMAKKHLGMSEEEGPYSRSRIDSIFTTIGSSFEDHDVEGVVEDVVVTSTR